MIRSKGSTSLSIFVESCDDEKTKQARGQNWGNYGKQYCRTSLSAVLFFNGKEKEKEKKTNVNKTWRDAIIFGIGITSFKV